MGFDKLPVEIYGLIMGYFTFVKNVEAFAIINRKTWKYFNSSSFRNDTISVCKNCKWLSKFTKVNVCYGDIPYKHAFYTVLNTKDIYKHIKSLHLSEFVVESLHQNFGWEYLPNLSNLEIFYLNIPIEVSCMGTNITISVSPSITKLYIGQSIGVSREQVTFNITGDMDILRLYSGNIRTDTSVHIKTYYQCINNYPIETNPNITCDTVIYQVSKNVTSITPPKSVKSIVIKSYRGWPFYYDEDNLNPLVIAIPHTNVKVRIYIHTLLRTITFTVPIKPILVVDSEEPIDAVALLERMDPKPTDLHIECNNWSVGLPEWILIVNPYGYRKAK